MTLITSRQNPKVKLIRSLGSRKGRTSQELFLVEGIRHVGEAVDCGAELEFVLYAPDLLSSEFAYQLISQLELVNVPVFGTTPEAFSDLAGKENPQGIMAVVHQNLKPLNQFNPSNLAIGVALESPQDPGNLGTILRTVDGAGVDALILIDGGTDIFHPTAVRASMGAFFWKPVVKTSLVEFRSWAGIHGFQLIGSSANGSLDYRSIKTSGPFILLLGSEQKGLSAQALELCDQVVRLPMRGKTTSLNLSVAAGILIYELVRGQE
ncbi:MAG: RNA methyltransferase [Anaerolineales bacterium]|nr:RNA methyltransferase [Anaerolineales bacterium]